MAENSETKKREYTRIFAKVFMKECEYLKRRRKKYKLPFDAIDKEIHRVQKIVADNRAKDPDVNPALDEESSRFDARPSADADLVGLALSGGGIRSATFNLGLLQALAKNGVLRLCDYLSTVSGGGYIGSSLTSLLDNQNASIEGEPFPFHFQRKEKPDESKEVKHLRSHSNYLALDRSLFSMYTWRIIGTLLSGMVLTNIVPFSLGIIIAYVLHLLATFMTYPIGLVFTLLKLSLLVCIIMVSIRAWASVRILEYKGRRFTGYILGALGLISALLAAVAGLISLAVYLPDVKNEVTNLFHGISLASLLGLAAGLLDSKNKVLKKIIKIVFRIALIAILPILFAELLRVLWATNAFDHRLLFLPSVIWIAMALLLLSLFVKTNRISFHQFYRDRLSEAYIIKRAKKKIDLEEIVSNEPLELKDLHRFNNGPYQLINATLNVPSSKDRYLRGRGADFFLFSKYFCGAESTGYRSTEMYEGGKTRLATAMAVSGAAASPQMGQYTSRLFTFLMTLFNIRLNRWMPNPNPEYASRIKIWPYYFVKELFGLGHETDTLVNISDGGHHENLGIFPLLKRHCRVIIASDAAADPDFTLMDLANLQRKARIDLGIDIEIQDMNNLRLDPDTKNTSGHYVKGIISYPDGKEGVLFYIKSSVIGDEPEDILAYRRKNSSFPDQSTGDQFFDEDQFESYRKLGELISESVFPEGSIVSLLEKD